MKQLIFIFFLFSFNAFAQKSEIFRIDSLPTEGVLLDKNWKWQLGDNPDFAKPDFDDSAWTPIDPTKDILDLTQIPKTGQIVWLRMHFRIDFIINRQLSLMVEQVGASDVFLNGKLIHSFGVLSEKPNEIKAFNPLNMPISFPITKDSIQILSVKIGFQPNVPYSTHYGMTNPAFKCRFITLNNSVVRYWNIVSNEVIRNYARSAVFAIVTVLFFTLFLFSPIQKANLYFSLHTFFLALSWYVFSLMKLPNFVEKFYIPNNLVLILQVIGFLFMLTSVYTILEQKREWVYRGLVIFGILSIPSGLFIYGWGWMVFGQVFSNLINLDIARVAILAARKNRKGAWIIVLGSVCYLVSWFVFCLQFFNNVGSLGYFLDEYMFDIALMSIPVTFAIFLSFDFGQTNRSLQQKLIENDNLSQEKQQILENQNETLEKQVTERTDALNRSLTELKETQSQLIEKEKIATSAAVQLKELDAVKTRLYTNITHEFRTPLTVILGMAQQAMDKPQEHQKEGLTMITRNGQNLLNLVNQMLDLNKLESGKLDLQYQQVDVVNFLKYIVESLHSLAENKGIKLHFLTDLDTLTMDIEENSLQQVVSNLLSNAVKFTPKGGNIYMTVSRQNDALSLKVKDTGVGISEEQLPHIFDRFYQADTTATRHSEGTGIGLSLTRELVKLMNGTIAVKSHLHKGSEFEVLLPITHQSDIKETNGERVQIGENKAVLLEESPLILENKSMNNEKPLVLIADDNADVRAYIASCLAADYNLLIAKDGRECEEMAFDKTPDLIVSDVMMPFKDGFEVCKTLKTDERTSHIPIIMLTAKADIDSKLQGFEHGADAYLMKPFNKEELLLRIKKLLELRQQLQQYYLNVGFGISDVGPNKPTSDIPNPQYTERVTNSIEEKTVEKNTPYINSFDNAFVIKVKSTVEKYISDVDLDIEKLARALALSTSQLNRKLTALTGLSTNNFMRYVRLIKSKELLLHSGYSVTAIAYDSGFNDPAYFIRVFKQEFGVPPQVWREQNAV